MQTKTKAPPTKPIPIRMGQDQRDRTDRAAQRLGITRAAVVKLALACKLQEIEAGHITLPA